MNKLHTPNRNRHLVVGLLLPVLALPRRHFLHGFSFQKILCCVEYFHLRERLPKTGIEGLSSFRIFAFVDVMKARALACDEKLRKRPLAPDKVRAPLAEAGHCQIFISRRFMIKTPNFSGVRELRHATIAGGGKP